jgi:hypothetical protein
MLYIIINSSFIDLQLFEGIVMEETKDDICEKLDNVLLEFFETLTKLYQNQAMLDQSMKSGYLNLSRAR